MPMIYGIVNNKVNYPSKILLCSSYTKLDEEVFRNNLVTAPWYAADILESLEENCDYCFVNYVTDEHIQ